MNDELRAETKRKDEEGWFRVPLGSPVVGSVTWDRSRGSWVVKEEGSGKAYAYGEDGKFASI